MPGAEIGQHRRDTLSLSSLLSRHGLRYTRAEQTVHAETLGHSFAERQTAARTIARFPSVESFVEIWALH